jgi:hypothetical protein
LIIFRLTVKWLNLCGGKMMIPKFEIRVADVSNKWLDGTKATVELLFTDFLDEKTCISYVHTEDTVKQVLSKKDEYKNMLMKVIEDNAKWMKSE